MTAVCLECEQPTEEIAGPCECGSVRFLRVEAVAEGGGIAIKARVVEVESEEE